MQATAKALARRNLPDERIACVLASELGVTLRVSRRHVAEWAEMLYVERQSGLGDIQSHLFNMAALPTREGLEACKLLAAQYLGWTPQGSTVEDEVRKTAKRLEQMRPDEQAKMLRAALEQLEGGGVLGG